MRLAARAASIDSINSPVDISRVMIRCLAAYGMRILNDISAYGRTVALKLTMVIIRSTL